MVDSFGSDEVFKAWWRHQIETFSALLAFCAGNSPVTGEFPAQTPATGSFDIFFDRAHYDVIVMGHGNQHTKHYLHDKQKYKYRYVIMSQKGEKENNNES